MLSRDVFFGAIRYGISQRRRQRHRRNNIRIEMEAHYGSQGDEILLRW
jgi:hypothetical protein